MLPSALQRQHSTAREAIHSRFCAKGAIGVDDCWRGRPLPGGIDSAAVQHFQVQLVWTSVGEADHFQVALPRGRDKIL
ncbi:hypothetical protein PF005_g23388 [Phytophthora fragariae]|uniref:Uncharacterized protein n=1 Tax=Phytophthora fragariae TaxID=53985 RepID=A0A6A4C4X6_9STRA|nr:hypothetical protein PF009_g14861 [Phytophthora fragariae]KAE8982682.1 hypothetical protein PF011_g21512 [Phytophthora fragariae]KAE9083087.1 hypothetical protein PF010_g21339 [Phytophthora fragariae]KAE9085398.1 hypothetical protein PF007_g21162 [Phytophthora fragariae]KAE9108023.1 hypothetical protein PF006_g20966 [Phytophthora fragariae]